MRTNNEIADTYAAELIPSKWDENLKCFMQTGNSARRVDVILLEALNEATKPLIQEIVQLKITLELQRKEIVALKQ